MTPTVRFRKHSASDKILVTLGAVGCYISYGMSLYTDVESCSFYGIFGNPKFIELMKTIGVISKPNVTFLEKS